MNAEQAYINGFVKRASAYGFSYNEAVSLLKQAAPPVAGIAKAIAPEARALVSGEQAAAKAMAKPQIQPPPSAPLPSLPAVRPSTIVGRLGQGVADFTRNQVQGFRDASLKGKLGRIYLGSKVFTTPAGINWGINKMQQYAPGAVSPYNLEFPDSPTNIGPN